MPIGDNEIAEIGDNGDTTDDYLWADWSNGVTVPPGIPGLTTDSLRKPSYNTLLPYINYNSTDTNTNLTAIFCIKHAW